MRFTGWPRRAIPQSSATVSEVELEGYVIVQQVVSLVSSGGRQGDMPVKSIPSLLNVELEYLLTTTTGLRLQIGRLSGSLTPVRLNQRLRVHMVCDKYADGEPLVSTGSRLWMRLDDDKRDNFRASRSPQQRRYLKPYALAIGPPFMS
jgi:hypothetical protein